CDMGSVTQGVGAGRTAPVAGHVHRRRAIATVETDKLLMSRVDAGIQKHDEWVDDSGDASRPFEGVKTIPRGAPLVDPVQPPIVTAARRLNVRASVVRRVRVVTSDRLRTGRRRRPTIERPPRTAV